MILYQGKYEVKRQHPYVIVNNETGEELRPPGVTSITGNIGSKEAIPQWASNTAAQTAIDIFNDYKPAEVYDIARKKYIELRNDAGEGGTEGHKWIETYLKGELEDEYCFESEHGIQFVEAYLEFEKDHPFDAHVAESLLFSEKYFYAGQRDDLVSRGGVYGTLDFKTGNPDFEYNSYTKKYSGRVKPYDAHRMQDAGYDLAEMEENGRISDFYGVVYLVKDPEELAKKYNIEPRKYFYFETDNTPYWRDSFLHARSLFDISKNNPYREVA